MGPFFRRLARLLRVSSHEAELREEMESHRALHQARLQQEGSTAADASRESRRTLGNVTLAREEARGVWIPSWLDSAVQDVRYTRRRLTRRPGLAIAVVLTLGLGIGVTTAMFSVVEAVLLRPLPWPSADRLVAIYATSPERRNDPAFAARWASGEIGRVAVEALRQSAIFTNLGLWSPFPHVLGDPGTDLVEVTYASASLLPLLGARASLGRLFTADDDHPASTTALLSYEGWQSHFNGRADIIGQAVVLRTLPERPPVIYQVVGVLPRNFPFPGDRPVVIVPLGRRGGDSGLALARLAPGMTMDQAFAVVEPIVRGSASPEGRSARLVSLVAERAGEAARPLWLLFGGAGLLLLVACSNVAGLLLGEARARGQEMAVRATLGGTRRRVLQQLVIEHLVLGVSAAVAGVVLATWLTPALVALAPARLPDLDSVAISRRVAMFALSLGVGTALLFGLAPALTLARTRAADALVQGDRSETPRRRRSQIVMLSSQIVFALVLLTCANLFGETLIRLRSQPVGFEPSNVAVATINLLWRPLTAPDPTLSARDDIKRRILLGRALHMAGIRDRLSVLPGVVNVAAVDRAPFGGGPTKVNVRADGSAADQALTVQRQVVTEEYFRTMSVAVLNGRGFETRDRQGPAVAAVSEDLERRLFAGGAVGKRILMGAMSVDVIGVVRNVRQREFSDDDLATLYMLDWHVETVLSTDLVVRTSTDAAAILPLIREAIREQDPQAAVTSITTMESRLARSLVGERFRAILSILFAGTAILLATVGLYGLTARQLAERRREIGVRVALGARPADVSALVLRDASVVVGVGLFLGLPCAYGVSQLAQSLLFGVTASAPHVFLMAAGLLAIVAVVATILPAHRAGRIDPMLALRE